MKTRAIILAGGEGSRLGTLTAKRTKPAVPFGGKYRIIDFTLSNCVNSGIFDVMIIAQYRPHSLIEHIGAGGPWDLNRDFTGGVRIYSPYRARGPADWFMGTADAVQQNFRWVKDREPDLALILSGDHIYQMNYDPMIAFHIDHQAELTIASIHVSMEEATRLGVLGVDEEYRVRSFVEKPNIPPSSMVNMGVYIFNMDALDRELWLDHRRQGSSHDFGKDIIPHMVSDGMRVFAYPYSGYWVDVGTVDSYWRAHMDLLVPEPSINLTDRTWVIHTRTEERPPVRIERDAEVIDSMVTDGCVLRSGSRVERCVLSAGVIVESGAVVRESIILTDAVIHSNAVVERSVIDKKVVIGADAKVGKIIEGAPPRIVMAGKKSRIPPAYIIEPGAVIGTDVTEDDYTSNVVTEGEYISTKRQANEV